MTYTYWIGARSVDLQWADDTGKRLEDGPPCQQRGVAVVANLARVVRPTGRCHAPIDGGIRRLDYDDAGCAHFTILMFITLTFKSWR